MAGLPTGTVTFLFTDIEGSTHLLQRLGDRYADVLETHFSLLTDAFTGHRGHIVNFQGDAVFVAFARAADAVAGAYAAQEALDAYPWSAGEDLRVRVGMHTGPALQTGDNYVGLAVHEASRICSAAHGGQVVLSDVTRVNRAGCVDSVATRHPDVHQDDVGRVLLAERDGVVAARCAPDHDEAAVAVEVRLDEPGEAVVVLGEQDSQRGLGHEGGD